MRDRKKITQQVYAEHLNPAGQKAEREKVTLEVLLDIRDLLASMPREKIIDLGKEANSPNRMGSYMRCLTFGG